MNPMLLFRRHVINRMRHTNHAPNHANRTIQARDNGKVLMKIMK